MIKYEATFPKIILLTKLKNSRFIVDTFSVKTKKKICHLEFVSKKSSSDLNICFVWQYHEIDYGNVSLNFEILNGV